MDLLAKKAAPQASRTPEPESRRACAIPSNNRNEAYASTAVPVLSLSVGFADVRIVVAEGAPVVAPAVEHPDDRDLSGRIVDLERDHRTMLVVRDPQPGTDIVALRASVREGRQALAVRDDSPSVYRAAVVGEPCSAM